MHFESSDPELSDPGTPLGKLRLSSLGDASSGRVELLESALILLLFFVFAGTPPPDVNEAHYLAKAKHYWHPEWCRGDLFLESADAHLVFYWTFGWTTKWLSLPATAWVGRLLTWSLLAWAWRRLSFAVVPVPLASALSAGLFLSSIRWCHMAGEWVVGGVEAKGFAYVLVLFALESIVKRRWNRTWILLGAASAFHALIGGWSAAAALTAWAVQRSPRTPFKTMLPGIMAGGLLAWCGLAPAVFLSWGVEREIAVEANYVYVFHRLAHHLSLHRFPWLRIVRFGLLCIGWVVLAWRLRSDEPLRSLSGFVAAAVGLAAIGGLIDVVSFFSPMTSAQWLRYYWFRLSDFAVPLGVALALTFLAVRLYIKRARRGAWLIAGLLVLATANLAETFFTGRIDPRPASVSQSDPAWELSVERRREKFAAWQRACRWISQGTPADAVFLTPRNQQTFKWWAQRSEAATWKDVPQDAQNLLEWRRRYAMIYPHKTLENGLTAHSDLRLLRLARRYGASYLVLDRTRSRRAPTFERVYPRTERNVYYEVYRLPVE